MTNPQLSVEECARETPEQAVSRIHNEFGRGPGNSFKYVGPGGMWKVNAVLELMRLAYLAGAKSALPSAPKEELHG